MVSSPGGKKITPTTSRCPSGRRRCGAMKRRKKPVAIKVFEAAMTKGDHLNFLKERYEKLKRGQWSPDPRK